MLVRPYIGAKAKRRHRTTPATGASPNGLLQIYHAFQSADRARFQRGYTAGMDMAPWLATFWNNHIPVWVTLSDIVCGSREELRKLLPFIYLQLAPYPTCRRVNEVINRGDEHRPFGCSIVSGSRGRYSPLTLRPADGRFC